MQLFVSRNNYEERSVLMYKMALKYSEQQTFPLTIDSIEKQWNMQSSLSLQIDRTFDFSTG